MLILLTSCGDDSRVASLIEATSRGDLDEMSRLIDRGANINGIAFEAWTPLTRAANAGQLEAVKLPLARGADINRGTGNNSSYALSPLFCAADHGHIYIVRFLVERGARLRLDPGLKASFLDRVRSHKNDELINLVAEVMAHENS